MFLCLSILCLIIYIIKKTKSKNSRIKRLIAGNKGEYKVIQELKNCQHLNNIYIEHNNQTTQIDHLLLLNNKTICILETKNWNGIIQGSPWKKYITIFNNGKTDERFNPYFQTKRQAEMLKQILSSNVKTYIISVGKLQYPNEISNYYISLKQLKNILKESGYNAHDTDDWNKLKTIKNNTKLQKRIENKHMNTVYKKDKKQKVSFLWIIFTFMFFIFFIYQQY